MASESGIFIHPRKIKAGQQFDYKGRRYTAAADAVADDSQGWSVSVVNDNGEDHPSIAFRDGNQAVWVPQCD
jgi:hypothetical protein